MCFAAWKITRDVYLSRFHILSDNDAITLLMNGKVGSSILYRDIVRVQSIGPLKSVVFLMMNRFRSVPPTMRRPFYTGMQDREILRRFWTLSSDMLVIAASGEFLLIPLGALSGKQILAFHAKRLENVRAGALRLDQGEFARAHDAYDRGAECFQGGRWQEALEHNKAAAGAFQRLGFPDYQADCLSKVVICLIQLGRYTEAANQGFEALAVAEKIGDDGQVAYILSELPRVWDAVGEPDELEIAFGHFERAAAIYGRLGQHFFRGRMVSNQAMNRERMYILTKGVRYLESSERLATFGLEILRESTIDQKEKEVRLQRARLHGCLARAAYHQGQWQRCVKCFEKAFDENTSSERVIVSDLGMWARALFELSEELDQPEPLRLKHRHEAMENIDRAMKLVSLHANMTEDIELFAMRGEMFWKDGNFGAAARDYEAAIELLEKRSFLLSRPNERNALQRRYNKLYPRVIEAHLKAGDAVSVDRAFQYSERAKARTLDELLSLSKGLLHKVPSHLRAELEEALRAQREAYLRREVRRHIEAERLPQVDSEWAEEWRSLGVAEERLSDVWTRAVEHAPHLAEFAPGTSLSIEAVRSQLPHDNHTAILEFAVCESGLGVFLITRKDDPAQTSFFIPGLGSKDLEEIFNQQGFLTAYNAFAEGNDMLLWSGWVNLLTDLIYVIQRKILRARGSHGKCISSVLSRFSITRLAIVPEGILNRLPLHAALPQHITVTLSPSSSILLQTANRATRTPRDILIVDIPDKELPEPEIEAGVVERQFTRAGLKVARLSRSDATADTILSALPRSYWVHYAGHAFSNYRSPWESRLCLVDDFLTAEKIMASGSVKAGAVAVVNGCSSGVSSPEATGEFVGLPAAFLAAGYTTVISTLWEIHAGTPVILMDRMYNNLLEGHQPVDKALREASVWLSRQTADSVRRFEKENGIAENTLLEPGLATSFSPRHPLHWAAFVIWGAAWSQEEVPKTADLSRQARSVTVKLPVSLAADAAPAMLEALRCAEALVTEKRFAEAAATLEDAQSRWGASFFTHSKLATVYLELGDLAKACHNQREAVDCDPNSQTAHYNLGCIYRDMAKVTEARECFEQALKLNPAYWRAMINLAQVINDPQEIVALLKKAALIGRDDEHSRRVIRNWARIAADNSADIGYLRFTWALQEFKRGNLRLCKLHLELAKRVPLSPSNHAEALGLESEILKAEGHLSESVRALAEAAKFDPSRISVWNSLAARRLLLIRQFEGDRSESESHLRKAVEECNTAIRLGDYAMPHQNLASAYVTLGDLRQAAQHGRIALEMAQQQMSGPPSRPCVGCPTEGLVLEECRACLRKAEEVLRVIEVAGNVG